MIDIKNGELQFKEYTDNYDKKNEMILSKIKHSYRVKKNAEMIAKSLELDQEQIELAQIIGILHDIGRFEQVRRFNSFNDSNTIDHADLGVEILKTNNYISKYCDEKYWNIILKAIRNHNKYKIEDDLNKEELLHTKIIRDADKIDILYLYTTEMLEKVLEMTKDQYIKNNSITYEVAEDLINRRLVDYRKIKSTADENLSAIGFIFDIYYDKSIEIISKNN